MHAGWQPCGPRSAALAAACAVLALLAANAGCGDEEKSAPPAPTTTAGSTPTTTAGQSPRGRARLTGEERRLLTIYDRRIEAHCIRVGRSLVNPRAAPSPRQQERAFAAADALIALAAEKPTAPLGAGQDTRLFLSDTIENLEGSNCDPRMIARLSEGLAQIPPAG